MKKYIAMVLAVVLLLSLSGCSLMEKEFTVIAYVDENLTEAEARSVGTKLNTLEDVVSVRFISAREALEEFVGQQEDKAAFDGVDVDALRHRYEIQVKTKDKKAVIALIEGVEGIAEVTYYDGLLSLLK